MCSTPLVTTSSVIHEKNKMHEGAPQAGSSGNPRRTVNGHRRNEFNIGHVSLTGLAQQLCARFQVLVRSLHRSVALSVVCNAAGLLMWVLSLAVPGVWL
jgi:hypothetical protein